MKINISVVDFHAHILPKADHGSDSYITSEKQLGYAKTANVDYIIATPHFYPNKDSVERFIKRRSVAYEDLVSHTDLTEYPKVILGAEILLCADIDKLPGLNQLVVDGTNILLVELPHGDFSDDLIKTARHLIEDGYCVLLAHAERYPYEIVEKMVDEGVKLQLNSTVFASLLFQRNARRYIKNDWVYALGSDIHRDDHSAYKFFMKAINKLSVSKIFCELSKMITDNNEV